MKPSKQPPQVLGVVKQPLLYKEEQIGDAAQLTTLTVDATYEGVQKKINNTGLTDLLVK